MAEKITNCICKFVDTIGFDVFFTVFLLGIISSGIYLIYKSYKDFK